MKKLAMLLFVLALCVSAQSDASAVNIDLGTAGSFGALAGSGVTNSVSGTLINGDVGSYPTPAIVGLLPADVNGILYPAAGAVVEQAQLDLVAAYNAAAGAPEGNNVSGVDLSGRTLDPNIYVFNATASFSSGNLTLNGHGNSSAQWIFKIGTGLTTAADFNVLLINGAEANNVFWQVGTSATIGIRNIFTGSILAMSSITINGTGTLNGRALARNAHVTFSTAETVNVPGFVPSEPTILVYKMTTAINPLIDYNDANGLEADVLKQNLSAYVVFGVDNAYVVDAASDANGPTAILFGKDGSNKFKITLGGNEPNSFVSIGTFGREDSIVPFEVTNMRKAPLATSVEIGFGSSGTATDFSIGTSLYGKNTTVDIGQAEKRSVAKSLKGQVRLDSEDLSIEGWGAATATLDSKLTKDANKNSRTVAATVANIQTTVLNGYTTETELP
jgi:hypothetical protein